MEAIGAMNAYKAMMMVEIHLRWAGQSRDVMNTVLCYLKGIKSTHYVDWLDHPYHPMLPGQDLVLTRSLVVEVLAA